jgi:hypothetical protein
MAKKQTLVGLLWERPEMGTQVGYIVVTHTFPLSELKTRMLAAAQEWVGRMGRPSRDVGWGDVIHSVPPEIWRKHGILDIAESPEAAFVINLAEPVAFGEGGPPPRGSRN